MKVKDLVKTLMQYHPELPVYIRNDLGMGEPEITKRKVAARKDSRGEKYLIISYGWTDEEDIHDAVILE